MKRSNFFCLAMDATLWKSFFVSVQTLKCYSCIYSTLVKSNQECKGPAVASKYLMTCPVNSTKCTKVTTKTSKHPFSFVCRFALIVAENLPFSLGLHWRQRGNSKQNRQIKISANQERNFFPMQALVPLPRRSPERVPPQPQRADAWTSSTTKFVPFPAQQVRKNIANLFCKELRMMDCVVSKNARVLFCN